MLRPNFGTGLFFIQYYVSSFFLHSRFAFTGKEKEVHMYFGLSGFSIFLAYLLTILSAILCLVYGILHWNKGQHPHDIEEELDWQKEQVQIDDNL
jgi:cellulose synthase/poly-beta-1,6-N-acetylglucosamine synthase-like glycosyltransferase